MEKYINKEYSISSRFLLLFFFLIILGLNARTQILHQAAFFKIEDEIKDSHIYEASTYVDLKQGFIYTILPPNSLILWCRLNEGYIGPHPYQPEVLGDERELNKNFPVGSLPGSFDVSSSGSANYMVPIEVPPGTAGMMPNLSLNYSSSAGNGILGMGFSLGGFSSISRSGKDIYHDGIITPILFNDANDKFFLDGDRLLLLSGTYGISGSEYRPETEYYTKVLLKNIGNDVYFEVWTKDGLIKEYGSTNESRIERNAPNTSGVYTWRLNKIKDYYGNFIQYNYHKDKVNGEYFIESIMYTGNENTNLATYNEIKFFYDESDDQNTIYQAGSKFQQRLLLRKIKTYSEGKLIKIYQFKYAKNFYSHLNEIILAAGDGTRINSTVINWGAKTIPVINTFNGGQTTNGSDLYEYYSQYPTCFADVNGDGVKEVIVSQTDWSGNWMVWKLMKYNSNVINQETRLVQLNSGILNGQNGTDSVKAKNFMRMMPVDFDKDGKEEILLLTYWYNPTLTSLIGFCRLLKFNQNNVLQRVSNFPIFQFYTTMAGPGNGQWKQAYDLLFDYSFHIADFNGDGFLDIFYQDAELHYKLKSYMFENYQWLLKPLNDDINIPNNYQCWNEIIMNTGDFYGDGKSELYWDGKLLGFNSNNNLEVIECPDIETLLEDHDIYNPSYYPLAEVQTEDFNGDGITDMLFRFEEVTKEIISSNETNYTYKSHWHIAYCKGIVHNTANNSNKAIFDIQNFQDGWNYQYKLNIKKGPPEVYNYSGTNHRLFVTDINNDGKADIVDAAFVFNNLPTPVPPPKLPTTNQITQSWLDRILISKGNDFENINGGLEPLKILYKGDCGSYPEEYYIFNDFTGNGNMQVFDGLRSFDVSPNLSEQKIVAFTNGNNSKTKIEYRTLIDPDVYTKGSDAQFPLSDIVASICVVKRVNYDNGTAEGANVVYKYEDLKIHNMGLGSLGFMKNNIINLLTGIQVLNTYETVGIPFYDKVLKESITKQVESDGYLSESINYNISMSYPLNDGRVHYAYANGDDKKNYLTNTIVSNQYNYDRYMNITSSNTYTKRIGASANEWETYTIYGPYTFIDNSNYWIPGLLSNISNTTTKIGLPSITHTTRYTYYENGKILTKVKEPNNINKTTATFYYDDYGNIRQNELSGIDFDTRINKVEYDPKGRFIIKTINPLNQAEFYEYNSMGQMIKNTDVNNLVTTYDYNSFGIQNKTNYPDGNYKEQTIDWDSNNPDFLFKIQIASSNETPVISYYDRLGRTCRKESKNINNQTVFTDVIYNDKGQVEKKSFPYFNGSTPLYIENIYDYVGRPKQTTYPDGTTEINTYSTNKITVTLTKNDHAQTIEKTFDVAGLTTDIKDNNGKTTHYVNNSMGLPINISFDNQPAITIGYTDQGLKNSMHDPDAGNITYDYYADGMLKNQTNSRNITTSYTYDKLGRVITKTIGSETTTYTYDTQPNGIGLPASVTSTNSGSETYYYDYLSRVSKSSKTIDGKIFDYQFTYNNQGKLFSKQYPGGFGVTYHYQNGYIQQIKDLTNGNQIWQANNQDNFGAITNYQFGNGITTQLTYNPTTHLLTEINTGNQSKNWWQYEYDDFGNMTKRWDKVIDKYETFTYDNLQRLTGINGPASDNLSYYADGRINFKESIGTYNYNNPAHFHAVTEITNGPLVNTPPPDHTINYTDFDKVLNIIQENKELDIYYGTDQQRVKTVYQENDVQVETKYFAGNYEKVINHNANTEKEINYISSPSGLVAINIKNGAEPAKTYYVCTDHLGSITKLLNQDGSIAEEYSYDAWGRRRNPVTWSYSNVPTPTILDRGYTGHEHLDQFGLINMNGRMYDPVLGRMLSPDNYIQSPNNSQNLDRYGYCLNNPLKYKDPDGNFFLGTIITAITDLFKTIKKTINEVVDYDKKTKVVSFHLTSENKQAIRDAWRDFDPTASWSKTNKAFKIDMGLFKYDESYSGKGDFWRDTKQVISRFTAENPQTQIALFLAHSTNLSQDVEDVSYFHGATVVRTNSDELLFTKGTMAYTYGSYIIGRTSDISNSLDEDNILSRNESVLLHEYGHYLQSQEWGPYLLLKGGVNSGKYNDESDVRAWSERDANTRTEEYFNNLGISTVDYHYHREGQEKRETTAWDRFFGVMLCLIF